MIKVKDRGFTLAEVLITLLIIGIVASLTIPLIIKKTNNTQNIVKLKKDFSVLQQAFDFISVDTDANIFKNPAISSTTGDAATDANAMNIFATKLNVVKNCGSGMGCWYNTPLKFLGSGSYSTNLDTTWNTKYGKAILSNGSMIMVNIDASSCAGPVGSTPVGSPLYNSLCGDIYIDINGASEPNTIGRDVFIFWITNKGIYPRGIFSDGYSCNINASTLAESGGCTADIINTGAMNY